MTYETGFISCFFLTLSLYGNQDIFLFMCCNISQEKKNEGKDGVQHIKGLYKPAEFPKVAFQDNIHLLLFPRLLT